MAESREQEVYNSLCLVDQAAGRLRCRPAAGRFGHLAARRGRYCRLGAAVTQFSAPSPTEFVSRDLRRGGIQPPEHGYTIMKVSDMLQSSTSGFGRGQRGTILVALEAAGVKIQDVIEDAVKRDRALDTYEQSSRKSVHDWRPAKRRKRENSGRNGTLEAEHRSRIQANEDAVAKRRALFRLAPPEAAGREEDRRRGRVISCPRTRSQPAAAGSAAAED